MSLKTARGQILIANGFEDPSSLALPNIISFSSSIDPENNKFAVYFSVERNYASLQLVCRFLDEDNKEIPSLKTIINVFGLESFSFYKDKVYRTSLELIATNKNGQDSRKLEPIDKANNNLNVFEEELISGFKIANTANTYDQVDLSFYLNSIAGFNIVDVEDVSLYYQRKDYFDWKILPLKNEYSIKKNSANEIESYFYDLKNLKIERPIDGGNFSFKINVKVNSFQPSQSNILSLYFDVISPSQPRGSDSTFPKAELIDADSPASLRYEISTRFSQIYISTIGKNESLSPFYSYFLNDKDYYKSSIDFWNLQFKKGDQKFFYYDYQYSINSSDTKGFFYPASVSEILPCILINQLAGQNQSVVLFWKINDDFFDYKFLNKNISIFTSYVKIKVQYKVNSSYQDLTKEIILTKDAHFKESEQKFVLFLRRDVDILENQRAVFDRIQDNDNKTDNLRILITEHKVDCSLFQNRTKTFTFKKLMIPDKWNYIAYDKYIPLDASIRNPQTEKINLNLNSLYLRGIRLPEEGFQRFDLLNEITTDSNGFILSYGARIIYKLASDFKAFYQDPIIEGTVNTVEIPSFPNDVFVTPPDLVIPPPNYVKMENGGIQAEGLVTLDEYGKINGIQIINPGKGYSFYTSALSKRQQTFTDLTPYVKTSYLIVGINQNNNPSALVIQNNSFDKQALLASMRGGVRLASANSDKALLNNSTSSLSELQNKKIDEYFQRQTADNAFIEDNSTEPYQVVTQEIEQISIGSLDEEWAIISQLYANKNINPYEQSIIYSEDTDAGVAAVEDSAIKSDPVVSNEITPITIDPEADQTSSSGGSWKMFELSGLKVMPDGSAAVSLVNSLGAPPSMTLLPTSVRSDNMYGFGPLPNMLPRAEMFNRFAMAVNNLNSVRVLAPFVWSLEHDRSMTSWYKRITDENEYDIVEFKTQGTRFDQTAPIGPEMLPINTTLSVAARRSVTKVFLKPEKALSLGLEFAGQYIESTEESESYTFSAFIHPSMSNAIPSYISSNIKRKYLGVVTDATSTCGQVKLPLDSAGVPYAACSNGSTRLFYSIKELPADKTIVSTTYKFFNNSNSVSLQARGTAKALQVFISQDRVCGSECGDSSSQTIDFSYTNMFPAIIEL
jgi:hypothetical protein